ncbi:MAG: VanZ family protein [Lachnospiraceae bacterium]|nr:VanZ family protein [Lachnospiraceae bacterium]
MFKYLIQDLSVALRYIPFVIMIGVCLFCLVQMINKKGKTKGKEALPVWSTVSFWTYLALVIMITFLSRESGDSTGVDLELGASLRINARNNALVLENVLLFVPYGFCYCWWEKGKGIFFNSFMVGFVTSLIIEGMQLVTGRGIFQLDDIIMNTLGCMLGASIYKLCCVLFRK